MVLFGWSLLVLGALFLLAFGVVGIDSAYGSITNLAGLIIGGALLTSGSVFVVAGTIIEALRVGVRPELSDPIRMQKKAEGDDDAASTDEIYEKMAKEQESNERTFLVLILLIVAAIMTAIAIVSAVT